jgi:hypothetical protein
MQTQFNQEAIVFKMTEEVSALVNQAVQKRLSVIASDLRAVELVIDSFEHSVRSAKVGLQAYPENTIPVAFKTHVWETQEATNEVPNPFPVLKQISSFTRHYQPAEFEFASKIYATPITRRDNMLMATDISDFLLHAKVVPNNAFKDIVV